MPDKMSTDDLQAALEKAKSNSIGGGISDDGSSELNDQRARAIEYYLGDMSTDMPSEPNMSSAVSMDVADVVDSLMPALIEIFYSGDEIVSFEPRSQEDEPAALQESDYVNWIVQQQNDGFTTIYTMIMDALLSKVGVAKVWWDASELVEEESYYDLDDDAFDALMTDAELELLDHTEHGEIEFPSEVGEDELPPDPRLLMDGGALTDAGQPPSGDPMPIPPGMGPPQQPGGQMTLPGMPPPPQAPQPIVTIYHDVTVQKRSQVGKVRIEAVPPEEFGILKSAKSVATTDYCYHETITTVFDLQSRGYDVDQLIELAGDDDDVGSMQVRRARDTVEQQSTHEDPELGDATKPIRVCEHYALIDYDGSGARRYKIMTGGTSNEILTKDGKPDVVKVRRWPFAAMTPHPMPHRFYGLSVADKVMDIQRIKTSVTRAMLNSLYFASNNRVEVAMASATEHTIDDVLNNRPGSVIRTKMIGGIAPVQTVGVGAEAQAVIAYFDGVREWRTGVSKQGMGLDANSLKNVGQEALLDAANASRQKQKMIARVFAETGIRDLFLLVHATARENDTKGQTVRLRNKWVSINPREWSTRSDMIVHVGLGDGTKPQQQAFLMGMLAVQKELIQTGSTIADQGTVYNTLKALVRTGGLRTADPYFLDPDETDEAGNLVRQPQPPPPDPKLAELEMKAQMDQAELKMKSQMDQARAQQEAQMEQGRAQQQAQIEERKMVAQVQLDDRKLAQTMQMEQARAQQQAEAEAARMAQKAELEKTQAMADIESNKRKTENDMALKQQEFLYKHELALIEMKIKLALQNQKMLDDVHADANDGSLGSSKYDLMTSDLREQGEVVSEALAEVQRQLAETTRQVGQSVQQIQSTVSSPAEVVRDEDGKIVGVRRNGAVQSVVRNPDGSIAGVQ